MIRGPAGRGREGYVLEVRVLGELEVIREGTPVTLPRSRKTRALLAYLAATGRPQRREHLCSLLWEDTDDPQGNLRWSLTKLRSVIDDRKRKRLVANERLVELDSSDIEIDAFVAKPVRPEGLADAILAALALRTDPDAPPAD